jgi:polysaccharide biosynthesis transport protein
MSEVISPLRAPAATSAGGPFIKYHIALCAVRRWWKLATPVSLLFAALAGAVVFLSYKPTYTAEAWLTIRHRQDHLLGGPGPQDHGNFIANQIEMMRSPPIVNPVAAIPEVAKTPEIACERDPVLALKRQVKIFPRGQSEYFVVQFRSIDPESAALVPNEIARAYLEEQRQGEGFRGTEILKLLHQELSQQQTLVEQARAAWYTEYTNAVGIAPDVVLTSQRTTKVVTESGVEAALLTQLTNAEVESLLVGVSLNYHEAQTPTEPNPAEIEQSLRKDADLGRLESAVTELTRKIQEYKSVAAGPVANQRLSELEEKKHQAEEALAQQKESLRAQIWANLENAAKSRHEAELLRLRAKKAELEAVVRTITEKLHGQRAKAESQEELRKTVGDKMFKVELLKSDYQRLQERLDLLKRRIENLELEQRAPARVEIYEYASVPTAPDQAAPHKRVGVAAAAGLLLPFGLAVGLEFLLHRVGSRDQLETGNAISVVGEVTNFPPTAKRIVGRTEDTSAELQLFEECIDGLRTYLTLVQSLQGMRVLAVASSVSGEGKTTLSSQLAISLARAQGARTLLIDGDIRLPDVHRIFNVARGPGLVDVLRGEVPVEEAIDTGYSETLHLLPAGRLRTSPHQLMCNGEFARLVDQLKETYRYIVVDTPPILPASEALVMAQASDATVLCVRRDYSRVHQVKEAYFRLQAAGVKTVGAVLNGIPSREYAYHYGSYYYARKGFHDDADEKQAEDVIHSPVRENSQLQ